MNATKFCDFDEHGHCAGCGYTLPRASTRVVRVCRARDARCRYLGKRTGLFHAYTFGRSVPGVECECTCLDVEPDTCVPNGLSLTDSATCETCAYFEVDPDLQRRPCGEGAEQAAVVGEIDVVGDASRCVDSLGIGRDYYSGFLRTAGPPPVCLDKRYEWWRAFRRKFGDAAGDAMKAALRI